MSWGVKESDKVFVTGIVGACCISKPELEGDVMGMQKALICCVIPPASEAATDDEWRASRRVVLP